MAVDLDWSGTAGSAVSRISEIGLSEAVQALTNLTGIPFTVSATAAASAPFDKLCASGNSENVSVGIYMAVEGDVPGHMASLCSWQSANVLWSTLLGASPNNSEEITELEASMMIEVGNIMNAAFLRAVVNQFDVQLLATPPLLGVDMTEAILSSVVTNAAATEHEAIAIRNRINAQGAEIEFIFLFIAEAEDLKRLFGQMGLREVA